MNDDIEQLRKDYRAIEAPPALATRIRAQTAGARVRRGNWLPAALVVTVTFLSYWFLQPEDADERVVLASNGTPKPSLASLATVMPKKPKVTTPNLSQVRVRTLPAPPKKPPLKPAPKPNTSDTDQVTNSKENDHAYS